MNEKNFDSISQFEVPKSWIENALNVPQNNVKKPLPLIKFTRTVMAVACFILVCGISVALYFITDDSSIPPVKPPVATHSINAETLIEDSTKKESDVTNSESSENTNQNESDTQSPSTHGSHPEISEDELEDSTDSKQKPNKKPEKNPTEKPEQNSPEKPAQTDASESPQVKPTEDEQGKPGDPTPPVELPTEEGEPIMPTQVSPDQPSEGPPPWINPTDSPYYPEVPETEGSIVYPTNSTQPPSIDYDDIKIRANIELDSLTGSGNVYCKLYSPDGVLLGDTNLFSSSHLAQKDYQTSIYVRVSYYPYRNLNITQSGNYKIIFYNEDGQELIGYTDYLQREY